MNLNSDILTLCRGDLAPMKVLNLYEISKFALYWFPKQSKQAVQVLFMFAALVNRLGKIVLARSSNELLWLSLSYYTD